MKRRIMAFFTALTLMMAMLVLTSAASAYYAVYSHCRNGKPLNVRSGPGKQYDVIDQIPYGQEIYVNGETSPGWLQLNDVGYVQASLTSKTYPGPYVPPEVKPVAPDEEADPTEYNGLFAKAIQVTPYTVTLQATQKSKGLANVRWAPSKKSTLLRSYLSGTQILVIAELKNWYQVYDASTNTVGFVHSAYVIR